MKSILATLILFACAATATATNVSQSFCNNGQRFNQNVGYSVQNLNGGYVQQFNGHAQNFNGYGQQQRRVVQQDFVVDSYYVGNTFVEEFASGRVRRTFVQPRRQFANFAPRRRGVAGVTDSIGDTFVTLAFLRALSR